LFELSLLMAETPEDKTRVATLGDTIQTFLKDIEERRLHQ
jgi:hypothetical protein